MGCQGKQAAGRPGHIQTMSDKGNRAPQVGDAPKRNFRCMGVIEGYMHINRHKAHVLLDGGSMLDMISANFTTIHKLEMFQLSKPLKLQMAMSGSRSMINYGARAELHVR